MFTDFTGKALDNKDVLAKFKRIPASSFAKVGPATYKAELHSHSGTRPTSKGGKVLVLNAVINKKGLVSFLGDPDETYRQGQDVVLEFTELQESNGVQYARFNALFELPE